MAFKLKDAKCNTCEHTWEVLLDSNLSNPLEEHSCPECGSSDLKTEITVSAGKVAHHTWSTWRV